MIKCQQLSILSFKYGNKPNTDAIIGSMNCVNKHNN